MKYSVLQGWKNMAQVEDVPPIIYVANSYSLIPSIWQLIELVPWDLLHILGWVENTLACVKNAELGESKHGKAENTPACVKNAELGESKAWQGRKHSFTCRFW